MIIILLASEQATLPESGRVSSFESIDPMQGSASYDSGNSSSEQECLWLEGFLLPLIAATAPSTFIKFICCLVLF